jgi:hypothetical protein
MVHPSFTYTRHLGRPIITNNELDLQELEMFRAHGYVYASAEVLVFSGKAETSLACRRHRFFGT